MEPILTLDLADCPARLRVVSVQSDKLEVLSETELDLGISSSNSDLATDSSKAITEEGDAAVNPQTDSPEQQNERDAEKQPDIFISRLSAAIEKIAPVWGSAALLVAPRSYHSLNLELPFKDDKNVAKVLSLEAQDRLPFDISEFFLEHKVLKARPDNQFDVHVALTRKEELANLLSDCQKAGLDPVAISTVSSLLEGRLLADPASFSANCILIAIHGIYAYMLFRVDGSICADRSINIDKLASTDLISEIKRSIGAMESRYNMRFEEVWIDNNARPEVSTLTEELSNCLTIAVKTITEQDPLRKSRITDWFATLCADGKSSRLFVNFRSGPFAQTLRWSALWQIFSSAMPYLLMFIAAFAAILFATYSIREREIDSLQQGIVAKVQPLLGETKLMPGQLIKSIQLANDTIEKQLKDLGSPSKFSPLDVLSEASRDFSSIRDVTISSINIRGTQLTVSGSSANYENVDAIEKVLQSKRTFYCRPSKQVSGTTLRQFTFTVILCD